MREGRDDVSKAQIPLSSSRHVSTRLDTFEVSRRDVTSLVEFGLNTLRPNIAVSPFANSN